jgi:hypothetical protein
MYKKVEEWGVEIKRLALLNDPKVVLLYEVKKC